MDHDATTPDRYHRQTLLDVFGAEGQARLSGGHALLVGCGALGSVSAELLARAGVGTITIIDRDVVELTNLQRQMLFDESDAKGGLPKAHAAARRLGQINSTISIRPIVADVSCRTIDRLVFDEASLRPDVIVDGTDNFQTRYLLNDLAVREGVPLVYAGAVGMEGLSMTILPGAADAGWTDVQATPCLRCVFPDVPAPGSAASSATCDTVGVLGPVTAMMASIQACEALKVLLGRYDAISRSLLRVNLWTNEMRQIDLSGARRGAASNDPCPCCAGREFVFLSGEAGDSSATLCGREAVQISPASVESNGAIDLEQLRARLSQHGSFIASRFMVRGLLDAEVGEMGRRIELTVFPDGRAIVGGTAQVARARSVYAKYVGA